MNKTMPNPFGIFGQRSQSADGPNNEPSVKEFKECVEEAKQEFPELSTGAINQIAVQRFTKLSSEQYPPLKLKNTEKRVSAPQVLNNVISKFILRKTSSDDALLTSKKPDPHFMNTSYEECRSLPLRKNISVADDLGDFDELDIKDSFHLKRHYNAEAALTNSLTNIELRRSAILSEVLSESECEGETNELNIFQSSFARLEDAEAEFGSTKQETSIMAREGKSSFEDSLSFDDEKSFKGDFSAWQRRRSSIRRASRRDSDWSTSSLDSFRASLGDFSAWRRKRTSVVQN